MEVRQQDSDLLAYDFNLEDKRALHTLFSSPVVRAYIQSMKTHYINNHILKPLEAFQVGNVQSNFMLDEAYLRGALDAFSEILGYAAPPTLEDESNER